MIQSKKAVFILIFIVGAIYYHLFTKFFSSNLSSQENEINSPSLNLNLSKRDTIVEIDFSMRDPFIRSESKLREGPSDEPRITRGQKRSLKNSPEFIWPEVFYYGLVKNRSLDDPLAIIKVNGVLLKLRQGSVFFGCLLKSVEKDQIEISKENNKKIIYR